MYRTIDHREVGDIRIDRDIRVLLGKVGNKEKVMESMG
jgi:hypothetical protein